MNSAIRFYSNLEDLCHPISTIVCNSFRLCRFIHVLDLPILLYEIKHELNMSVCIKFKN